jgi:group I intron endonuclease
MQEIKSGIYGIRNTINNKIYIGKSKNILKRWASHKSELKREIKKKDTNRYLWSSVKKYGLSNFEFTIIEELLIDEELFKIRELYWMDSFNSCNRDFGYNLRRDSRKVNIKYLSE